MLASCRPIASRPLALPRRLKLTTMTTPAASTSSSSSHPKEDVTAYPRPPRLEPTPLRLRVLLNGETIADTSRAFRVLETFHPPTYYITPEDCNPDLIQPSPGGSTMCEWKGRASYFDVVLPGGQAVVQRRVWAYPNPTPNFRPIAGYYAFYASPFECYVDEEKVEAQPGDFYGGWKTSWIEGTIKGAPGTMWM